MRDTVREALDLSAISCAYKSEQGRPPYHPGMLVALLLCGYEAIERRGSIGHAGCLTRKARQGNRVVQPRRMGGTLPPPCGGGGGAPQPPEGGGRGPCGCHPPGACGG